MGLKTQEFWFIVGSQYLYGTEVLNTVSARASEMASFIDAQPEIPCRFRYKGMMKTADEIELCMKEANADDACIGVVTWMHTFSRAKCGSTG